MANRRPADTATGWSESEGRWCSHHALDLDYIRTNIPCQWACPARTNIPGYVGAIERGNNDSAHTINQTANLLPGVLGRICSRPCELACRHGEADLGQPVSICSLKRFAADGAGRHRRDEDNYAATGKSVAVVGAGPAGAAVAHSLTLFGHQVTVYEAEAEPGGMLRYGIPAFRLPREILTAELDQLLAPPVEVKYGVRLGTDVTLAELRERHDAVVLAAGCYEPRKLAVPGEDLPGVQSGLDFVMRVNSGQEVSVGKRVIVIGGGFTAMDCARLALRLGAEDVSIHVLPVEEDLEVTKEEIFETKREGIRLVSLVTAVGIEEDGKVEAVQFQRNRMGRANPDGVRWPEPIEGSDFTVPADTVISAIGQTPVEALYTVGADRQAEVDAEAGTSSVEGIFAAGDVARGASTVIEAIGHGKRVAERVDRFLMQRTLRQHVVEAEPTSDTHRKRGWDFLPHQHLPTLSMEQRLEHLDVEVEQGYPPEAGQTQARRCYLCNLKYEIDIPHCIYCRWCIEACPRACIHLVAEVEEGQQARGPGLRRTTQWNEVAGIVIDSDRCIRCGECFRVCPTRCISVTRIDLVERLAPKE